MTLLDGLSLADFFLYALGFFAQGLFGARTIVQWVQSERAGKVVSPTGFWIFSLAGSSLFLVYGLLRHDVIILCGQTISFYIYIRNLQLKHVWKSIPRIFQAIIIPLPFTLMVWTWFAAPERLQHIFTETNFAEATILIGGVGQLLLNFRYLYQWYFSEKAQESLLPLGFWIISALASLMVVYYGIMNREPVLLVAQSMGFVVYLRNIYLALRTRRVMVQ